MPPGRRILCFLASVVMLATVAACGGGSSERDGTRWNASAATTAAPTTATPVTEAPTTTVAEAAVTTPPPDPAAPTVTAGSAGPRPPGPSSTSSTAPRRPGSSPVPSGTRSVATIEPYVGLGTWVDVYDWSHYRGSTPVVGPDQVDQMAREGVETLFLQTAKEDTPELISEPELLLPIIERAHERGMRVVAWYLPTLEDPANDLNRLLASAHLDVDGVAVDIESRKVGDVAERNRRLIELSAQLRQALPGRAIGAIVLPPVLLEVVNPNYWPDFPYQEIAPSYDVWQTMGYWTDRRSDSGYRDPYRYTEENIRRLRNNLEQPDAPVHPVGGVGGKGAADIEPFVRAAVEQRVLGASVYDWRTTRAEAWPTLRKFRSR